MQVLNFYSTIFADQLKRGRKTATIRLGDKSHKYKKNQAVLVTIGYQHSPREKIFACTAMDVQVPDLMPHGEAIGIDVGISYFAAVSNGSCSPIHALSRNLNASLNCCKKECRERSRVK
jgi:transposase